MDESYVLSDHRRFVRIVMLMALFHLLFLVVIDFFPQAIVPLGLNKLISSTMATNEPLAKEQRQQVTVNIASQHKSLPTQSAAISFAAKPQAATAIDATHVKKRIISAAAHQSQDAAYLGKWQSYIEEFGNQHYPQLALKNNIRGDLRLLVAINRDGSLREVTVRQSSGSPILDAAAIQIVQQAAPFEPLPDSIAEDIEVLEIIRTWQFRGKFSTS